MPNPIAVKTFDMLANFSLVTTATEAEGWHKSGDTHGYGSYIDPDETLVVTNETGVRREEAEYVLGSSRNLLITPAAQRLLNAHIRRIEEERDGHKADLAAIARAKEIFGL